MPAIAPVPPPVLRDCLLEDGWSLFDEDSYNWVLVKNGRPLVIPKRGGLVAIEISSKVLEIANLNPGRYFELLEIVGYRTPS